FSCCSFLPLGLVMRWGVRLMWIMTACAWVDGSDGSSLQAVPYHPELYESTKDKENYYMFMSPKVVCDNCTKKEDKYEDPYSLMQRCESIVKGARIAGIDDNLDLTSVAFTLHNMIKDLREEDAPRLIYRHEGRKYELLKKFDDWFGLILPDKTSIIQHGDMILCLISKVGPLFVQMKGCMHKSWNRMIEGSTR
uniref:Uncharacterized protein n=1 Tax=Parascaris univalens TaxID=6257 RepID=A0A915AXV8_PARUN